MKVFCTYLWNIPFEIHDSKVWDVQGENWRFYKPLKLGHFVLKNRIRITRPKYHVTRATDVIWVPQDQLSMAESQTCKRQRGQYCIAGAPNKQSCQNRAFMPGIHMYKFPKDIDMTLRIRPQSTRRFVQPILKNRVMKKTWPYSAVWRPRVLKWIGAWIKGSASNSWMNSWLLPLQNESLCKTIRMKMHVICVFILLKINSFSC